MQQLLGHLTFIKIFLDDFLVFSATEDEHAKHLNAILDILVTNNISLSFEKSLFFQKSVTFLGHIISSDGICPDTSLITDLKVLQNHLLNVSY